MSAATPDVAVLLIAPAGSPTASAIQDVDGAVLTVSSDPRAVHTGRPDVIVTHLPAAETLELLVSMRARNLDVPVIAACETDEAGRILSAGARDVILEAGEAALVRVRVTTLVEMITMRRMLTDSNLLLEHRVRERTLDLESTRKEMLDLLVVAAEWRDDDTRDHTRRVGETSAMLAAHTGQSTDFVDMIRLAAPLHDIGKIGIPDAILLKPARLDEAEFDQIRGHSVIGARILWGAQAPVLKVAGQIALCHHERWDGTGYPLRFKGTEIPLPARIVAVTDVFDALTHERPYKHAWPVDRALDELRLMRETHLDPALIDGFLEIVQAGNLEKIGWT